MSTQAKSDSSVPGDDALDAPVSLAEGGEAPSAPRKRKKKYTRGGLKFGQKAEVPLTRGVQRLARAVEEGLGTWRKKRSASARKKKNGALRDALENYGKAATKFQKVAAKIPKEVTKGFPKIRLFN